MQALAPFPTTKSYGRGGLSLRGGRWCQRPGRCQMYSVPPVEWSFPLPTGSTIRPPTTIGLFQ